MNRSLGKWKLPQPTDIKDEEGKEWSKIPRISRIVPFGYERMKKTLTYLIQYPLNLKPLRWLENM